jgi:hypothetical protein
MLGDELPVNGIDNKEGLQLYITDLGRRINQNMQNARCLTTKALHSISLHI